MEFYDRLNISGQFKKCLYYCLLDTTRLPKRQTHSRHGFMESQDNVCQF